MADHAIASLMESLAGRSATKRDFLGMWEATVESTQPPPSVEGCNRHIDAAVVRERAKTASFCKQISEIVKRHVRLLKREKIGLRARAGQTIFFALLAGGVYINLGRDEYAVQDRNGMLFFSLINQMFAALLQAVLLFPAERTVFEREHLSGFYGTLSYFIARTIPDTIMQIVFPCLFAAIAYPMAGLKPGVQEWFVYTGTLILTTQCAASMAIMLGAAAPTPDLAVALAPLPAVPFIVAGGFFANSRRFSGFWVWLQKLSFFSYCFEILAVNEYSGQKFDHAPPPILVAERPLHEALGGEHPNH